MRRRLLALAVTLVSVVLIALAAPLITTYAENRSQALYVTRLGDATRFAELADDVIQSGRGTLLEPDLERYSQVYGGSVLVMNADQEIVARTGAASHQAGDHALAAAAAALAGEPSPPPGAVWPWSDNSVIVASPVGRDTQVLGAIVVVAPTDTVQQGVTRWFTVLLVAGLATLLLTVFGVVVPFVTWILRPIHDLDVAAKRLSSGDLSSRAHQQGPPELRDLAGTFNQMADHVEVSQRQQRDLVADAAHQLGNPLTSLRLRIEQLGRAGVDQADVGILVEETERLSDTVESLLDLSNIGAETLKLRPVDVAAATRHRCAMWAPVFEQLHLEAPEIAIALGTDGVIDVVLDAALDNASKFAEGAAVDVLVVRQADHVLLRIRDHGPGLDLDDVSKVSSRFFRGRRHQNIKGTGLGLAIVRARVEAVGGSVEISMPADGGLQIDALLNAAPGSSESPPGEDSPAR